MSANSIHEDGIYDIDTSCGISHEKKSDDVVFIILILMLIRL